MSRWAWSGRERPTCSPGRQEREAWLAFGEAQRVIQQTIHDHVRRQHPDASHRIELRPRVCVTCQELAEREDRLTADYLGGAL